MAQDSNTPLVKPGSHVKHVKWNEGAFVLIDKPQGWTSFDVVNKMRSVLRQITGDKKIKVGHAGTLDPMATGLLLIAIGKATKQIQYIMGLDKRYTGKFLLGASTPSYDKETPVNAVFPTDDIDLENFHRAVKSQTGEFQQLPPAYSAIKKDGKPLYLAARRGEVVELNPRQVHVYLFETDTTNWPEVSFEVHCSKGTYIRSLAHDVGRLLNNAAHLTALRRTAIGPHQITDAWNLEDWLREVRNQGESPL